MAQDDTDIFDFDKPLGASRQSCESCGYVAVTSDPRCSICGGEMANAPTPLIDLGIDINSVEQGAEALSVHRVLARYAGQCNIRFTLGDNDLTPEQIFQPEALLPVISIEALRIWQTISQRPGHTMRHDDTMHVEFRDAGDGFFPYSAYPPGIGHDASSTLRLLTFVLASRRVLGMVENTKIDLVPFLTEWNKIDWSSDSLPDIPIPSQFDPTFMQREFITTTSKPQNQPAKNSESIAANPFASQNS